MCSSQTVLYHKQQQALFLSILALRTHLFVEKEQLLIGGFVSFHQLDCNLIHPIHKGFVHHSKTTLSKAALLVL